MKKSFIRESCKFTIAELTEMGGEAALIDWFVQNAGNDDQRIKPGHDLNYRVIGCTEKAVTVEFFGNVEIPEIPKSGPMADYAHKIPEGRLRDLFLNPENRDYDDEECDTIVEFMNSCDYESRMAFWSRMQRNTHNLFKLHPRLERLMVETIVSQDDKKKQQQGE